MITQPLKIVEIRSRVFLNEFPFAVKAPSPNAVTRAAMQEAENSGLPRFATTQELFDGLEECSAAQPS